MKQYHQLKVTWMEVLIISVAILAIVALCSTKAYSQMHAEVGVGVSDHPVGKLSFGYQLAGVVIEAVEQPSITKQANSDNYFGFKAGYSIAGLVPMIGYYYDYKSADDKARNKWGVGYSLKYIYLLGDAGGLFAEGTYINNVQVVAGFHIRLK